MVDSIMPSKGLTYPIFSHFILILERYEEEVSKVKADLLRSTGKVFAVFGHGLIYCIDSRL